VCLSVLQRSTRPNGRCMVVFVLQCAAVCCSVLQYVALCCSVLQCIAMCGMSQRSLNEGDLLFLEREGGEERERKRERKRERQKERERDTHTKKEKERKRKILYVE